MTPAKPAPAAQAAPAKPKPKRHFVRRRVYHEHYRDTESAADRLNAQELAQSPVVASPPRPIAVPVPGPMYPPPPAFYPPPPPAYYPPPWYWRPY